MKLIEILSLLSGSSGSYIFGQTFNSPLLTEKQKYYHDQNKQFKKEVSTRWGNLLTNRNTKDFRRCTEDGLFLLFNHDISKNKNADRPFDLYKMVGFFCLFSLITPDVITLLILATLHIDDRFFTEKYSVGDDVFKKKSDLFILIMRNEFFISELISLIKLAFIPLAFYNIYLRNNFDQRIQDVEALVNKLSGLTDAEFEQFVIENPHIDHGVQEYQEPTIPTTELMQLR